MNLKELRNKAKLSLRALAKGAKIPIGRLTIVEAGADTFEEEEWDRVRHILEREIDRQLGGNNDSL